MGLSSYTNDPRTYKRACRFYREAVEDGWEHGAAVLGIPEELSAWVARDEFLLTVFMRDRSSGMTGTWEYDAGVWGVGPDRLPIAVPPRYDMELLRKALRICAVCGAEDVDTGQLDWRTRACSHCIEESQKKPLETPKKPAPPPVPKENPKRPVGLFSSGIS